MQDNLHTMDSLHLYSVSNDIRAVNQVIYDCFTKENTTVSIMHMQNEGEFIPYY